MEVHFANLTMLMLLLGCYPIGRVVGVSGVFPSIIAGLIVLATPIAIAANFNAASASFLVNLFPFFVLFSFAYTVLHLKKISVRRDFTAQLLLTLVGCCTLLCGLILYWSYLFEAARFYPYNSHDYYFSAIPLELLIADYPSRLRMFYAYPLEWSQFYFLQGAALAATVSLVPDPNFFSIKMAKYLLTVLSLFAVLESFWRCPKILLNSSGLSRGSAFQHRRLFVFASATFFLLLSTVYYESFLWGFKSNSFLAFGCAFLFAVSRLKKCYAESYVWLLLLSLSQLKAAPICLVALLILLSIDTQLSLAKCFRSPIKAARLIYIELWRDRPLAIRILILTSVLLVYLLITMQYPVATRNHVPYRIPSLDLTLAWWALSPEAQLAQNIWAKFLGFFDLTLKGKGWPTEFPNEISGLFIILAIVFYACMAAWTVGFKNNFYWLCSFLAPLVFAAFLLKPEVAAPIAGILSLSVMIVLTVGLTNLASRKSLKTVFTILVIIVLLYPIQNPMGNILMRNGSSNSSSADLFWTQEKALIKFSEKSSRYVYCGFHNAKYNEAVGGHFGFRVGLNSKTLFNIETLKWPVLPLRHVLGFNEETLSNKDLYRQQVHRYACDKNEFNDRAL